MRVTIDRNLCGAWIPACEKCFSVFMARGVPDRLCVTSAVEDDSTNLTLLIHSGEHTSELVVTEENRATIMAEGWRKFANLPDGAFEIKPPHGEYWRKGGWRG
ncbi:MAG: hypothetical protein HZB51_21545 [Chloroflexi bacterium]|nr:hypothetical protein [Chloroflexota bacterium]